MPKGWNFRDLTGQQFSRLTVLYLHSRGGANKPAKWLCQCACGQQKIIRSNDLTSKNVKSCGCIQREHITNLNYRHGKSNRREYQVWAAMKDRCLNKNNTRYGLYGGRGIGVDTEWVESFEVFFQDMGECPAGYSLDRIDNNKGYSKENCRWATRSEQQRNRRDNARETYRGETKTIAEWAEETGMPRWRIDYGIQHGWGLEDILQKDFRKHFRTKIVESQTC